MKLIEETPYRFRIDPSGDMRVPGVVFASKALLPEAAGDQSLQQVANVAALPGIVGASYAMPDIHWGYGFPIGGVAATDVRDGGVVSPGGVGFDISCGVRLLAADLSREEFTSVRDKIMDGLARVTPRGAGKGAIWPMSTRRELDRVLTGGARYVVEQGRGTQRDLDRCEEFGAVADADPGQVSDRAVERGLAQLGSLGSGNHFLEVQAVEQVHDDKIAAAFGLREGQVCVMIHCGSRGLGHQVCTDHVRGMERAMPEHGITVPDRQLACVPVDSPEGRAYLGAMAAAANYARANRHLLGLAAADVFGKITGRDLELVYDISHNLAKVERHEVDGVARELCVHRKGATRALPPGHPDLPADLSEAGQPVLIPGSMGTGSYVLAGVPGGGAFYSTCHGAGRVLSRTQAAKKVNVTKLVDELERQHGIAVRGASRRGLAEEAPAAYKDVSEVVSVAERAGLCRIVAKLVPLGVVKG